MISYSQGIFQNSLQLHETGGWGQSVPLRPDVGCSWHTVLHAKLTVVTWPVRAHGAEWPGLLGHARGPEPARAPRVLAGAASPCGGRWGHKAGTQISRPRRPPTRGPLGVSASSRRPSPTDTCSSPGRSVESSDVNWKKKKSGGIKIICQSEVRDFSAMAFITDHVISLIDQWFPGERGGRGRARGPTAEPRAARAGTVWLRYTRVGNGVGGPRAGAPRRAVCMWAHVPRGLGPARCPEPGHTVATVSVTGK